MLQGVSKEWSCKGFYANLVIRNLGIKPERLNINFVTNPSYVETCAKYNEVSFISGMTKSKNNNPAKFKEMRDNLGLKFSSIKTEMFKISTATYTQW